jgi:hypothetical protein
MVREFVFATLASLLVPVQLPTLQPSAGAAVNWIGSAYLYWPAGQPGELAGAATGSLPEPVWDRVRAKHGAKYVTETVWGAAGMVSVLVAAVLASLAVPLQLWRAQPVAGCAAN